ncbi:cytochrome P450 [Nocardia sp. NPDC052278]|uniref:cytochrome P450 n=1 Tax=unclassified Nocardia TaxID=2637762 RepID=UPI0036CEB05C
MNALTDAPLHDAIMRPEFVEDPYGVYGRMVTDAPLFWATGTDLLVSNYALCRQVLTDADTFGQRPASYLPVLGAGHHTSVNLIGNGMRALLSNPDQVALLKARPELIGNAVEEMLRIDPPLQVEPRLALRDTTIGGEYVAEGTMVHAILAAANRDPEVFADPERFDVARADAKKHLSFGMGIHHWLGASLARTEGLAAVSALLTRLDGLRLDGDAEHDGLYRPRGLADLPVTWDA